MATSLAVDSAKAPLIEAAEARAISRRRVRAIVASSSGNLIEWYDFYTYAFTALYFAPSFFPAGDQTAQLLNVAGVYAAGFLMRPLGGWFWGRYADRHGRKAGIVLSILMMGAGSLMIAILPTYTVIGQLAPFLLLVARLAQGFSTGGLYGAAATYLSEVAISGHRGFYASFQYVTLIGGQLAALLVLILLQQLLSENELRAWGWRIPFAMGAIAVLAILFFRDAMHETARKDMRHPDAGSMTALLRQARPLLIVSCLTAGGSLMFYTFTTYMQKYLVNTSGMTTQTASGVMTGVLFIYMLIQPIFGWLSDKIGRRTSLIIFAALATVCTLPLLSALARTNGPVGAFMLILAALVILSFYTSISGLFKAELFPMEIRALGVGLSFGVANAVFGGSAEYVALWLKQSGHEEWFYWYVSAVCAVSLATALLMRDPGHHSTLD